MYVVLSAFACSFLWAGVTIAAKMLAGAIPSFAFAFLRYGLASLCLLPFLLLRKEKEKLHARSVPVLLFLGFTLVFVFNALFFTSLYYASATSISLIGAINPILTMLVSAIVFHHIPNRYQLFAFLLSFIGVSLVITQGKMGFAVLEGSIGELLMLVAVLSQIMYTMALKKISADYSPLFLSFATGVSGILFVLPFVANKEFYEVVTHLTAQQWSLLAYISCLGTALGIILFSYSIKHAGPVRTSLTVFSTMPVFVFILAHLMLGEQISIWQLLGGVLVVSSLAIGLRHTR